MTLLGMYGYHLSVIWDLAGEWTCSVGNRELSMIQKDEVITRLAFTLVLGGIELSLNSTGTFTVKVI